MITMSTSVCASFHLHYFMNLVFGDGAVPVHVVQSEGPLQLLDGLPWGCQMQSHDVLFKVQRPVAVGVEAPEDVLSVSLGIGVGEEAGVDALELLAADAARRTLVQELLVPGVKLLLAVLGVHLQLLQKLFGKRSTFSIAHVVNCDQCPA